MDHAGALEAIEKIRLLVITSSKSRSSSRVLRCRSGSWSENRAHAVLHAAIRM